MSFSDVVEISSTFPSPLGGAVFKGIPVGNKRSISFIAARWVISRVPLKGEYWKIEGNLQHEKKYGEVVLVTNAFLSEMPAFTHIGRLLNNHPAFKGFYFGKRKVEKLIVNIGDFALVDLLNKGNYLALSDGGLSESISIKVCEVWGELKEETEIATFLYEYKLDSALAKKIVRLCKYDTVARLKRNPYSLVALSNANKRTFRSIFKVANKLGISPNDQRALIGCIEFVMYSELERGNTIVEIESLKAFVDIILRLIKSDIDADDAIKAALEGKYICVLDIDGQTYLQSIGVACIEQFVEDKLLQLQRTPLTTNVFTEELEKLTERLEEYNEELLEKEGYKLNHEQKSAVIMALTNRVSVLSGFGGTGKTTVLKAIVELAKTQLRQTIVAALAGKAANRASQSIGETAFTIHSLINSIKKNDGTVAMESDPLIILDESSMIDISLICNFLKLFKEHKVRFVFVGDTAQLSPIGFGLFYHRLVDTKVEQVRLSEVYRMALDSPLHNVAMAIRNNETRPIPVYSGQASGVYLLPPKQSMYSTLIKLRRDLECMILTPYSSKEHEESTVKLNPSIQSMVNRVDETKAAIALGNTMIGVGDPVMATKNKSKEGIFNGVTGIVVAVFIKENETCCTILFDGQKDATELTKEQCIEVGLQLAYAITIHKSQGSEYDVCAIVLGSPFIENSAIYTALTRTKRLCILVGTQEQFDEAVLRPARYKTINSGFFPKF